MHTEKGAAEHCCRTAPGVNNPKKVRPSIAAGPHRVLTIEVWHQTSGCKGTNFLREEEIGFHLAPAGTAVMIWPPQYTTQ